jgi:hypothetical protein
MNGTEGSEYFSNDILVEKGESVKVIVEADIYASDAITNKPTYKYELTLKGEDDN